MPHTGCIGIHRFAPAIGCEAYACRSTLARVSGSLAAAFLPWLLFVLVARTGGMGLGWAALVSLGAALVIAAVSHLRRVLRGFEVASVAAFGALGLVDLVPGAWWPSAEDYARALAAACLAVIALGSVALRRPFTAAYTRDVVPPGVAADEMFLRANTLASAVWGLCALGASGSYTADALSKAPATTTIFNWLVPLALALCGIWCCLRQWRVLLGEDDDGDDQALLASLTTTPTVRRAAAPAAMAPRTTPPTAADRAEPPATPPARRRHVGLRAVRDDVLVDPGAGR